MIGTGEPGGRRLGDVRRLVVKVGTSSLVDETGGTARSRLAAVVREVAGAVGGTPAGPVGETPARRGVVLVSSGAIASGLGPLGYGRRPKSMSRLQAAAAVGQGRLMAEYLRLFARHGLVAGQVLLTQDDFVRRRHFVNAQHTLNELLAAGVVPVVNENDTVGTEEIRFGDNDRLAALVAVMVKADLLVLLSDVDGIFTSDPRRPGARLLGTVTDPAHVTASGPGSARGSGGMASKLEAAGMATAAGIPTVVANASSPGVLARILAGEEVGTWVPARAGRTRARKAWMAFAAEPQGRIVVDEGAARAVREAGRSLLAAGVVDVSGSFGAGDAVEVAGPDGRAFARGITNYAAAELPVRAGRVGIEGELAVGGPYRREVIHRDELVLLPSPGWTP